VPRAWDQCRHALQLEGKYGNESTDKMVLDKKMVKRKEEIEALPEKEKEKIFDYIDLVIRDIKIKKAHAS
jgi:hypothetical protein